MNRMTFQRLLRILSKQWRCQAIVLTGAVRDCRKIMQLNLQFFFFQLVLSEIEVDCVSMLKKGIVLGLKVSMINLITYN